jgi:hypothetical protein
MEGSGSARASCFRLYLVTLLQRDVRVTGRLADSDWNKVQQRVQLGIAGAKAHSSR